MLPDVKLNARVAIFRYRNVTAELITGASYIKGIILISVSWGGVGWWGGGYDVATICSP